MFFGTSILKAFWEDFGRVLGGQNPRFSHFFRCFFEANFEARFGREKNRPKWPHGRRKRIFGAAIRSSQGSWGEKKRGESRTLWPELFRQVLWGQDFADRTRDEARWSPLLRKIAAWLGCRRSRPNFDVEVRRTGNSSSKLELRSFSFKFEISSCIFLAKRPQISQKLSPNPPKSSPDAFKTLFSKDI